MLHHERITAIITHESNQQLIDADLVGEYADARLGERGDIVLELSEKALVNAGVQLCDALDPIKSLITLLVSHRMETERITLESAVVNELAKKPHSASDKPARNPRQVSGGIPGAYFAQANIDLQDGETL